MMRSLVRGMIVAALVVVPQLAQAQSYPNKPIKLIVPFPAGGPADTIARVLTEKMAPLLGQPIILENRGGAGGVTGVGAVAKAEPDGYTIGISSAGPLAITPVLSETMPYDVLKDLKLLTEVVEVPELLVVADNVPARTFGELIARQVETGQAQFRLDRCRRRAAHGRGIAQGVGRNRHRARAVSWRRTGCERPARRSRQHDVRRHPGAARQRDGRQTPRACHRQRQACAERARRADDGRARHAAGARQQLAWAGGAERHSSRNRRQNLFSGRRGAERDRGPGQARPSGRNHTRPHGRRVFGSCEGRDGAVGAGLQGGRRPRSVWDYARARELRAPCCSTRRSRVAFPEVPPG